MQHQEIVKTLDHPLIVHVVLRIIMFSQRLTLENITWNLLDDYWKNLLNDPSAVPFQFLAKSLENCLSSSTRTLSDEKCCRPSLTLCHDE